MSRDEPYLVAGDHHDLRIDVRETATAWILTAAGEFDNAAALYFEATIAATVGSAADRVLVVDLSGLTYLGTTGLSELLKLHHELPDQLRVVVATSARRALQPLQIGGLHQVLRLYETLDQASQAAH